MSTNNVLDVWKITKQPAGIYKITCTANGKFYIGQSTSLGLKWASDMAALFEGRSNYQMQNDFNQFGATAFTFSIVELVNDKTERNRKTEELIQSLSGKNMYNTLNTSTPVKQVEKTILRKKETVGQCPHCRKVTTLDELNANHFDNCKMNTSK